MQVSMSLSRAQNRFSTSVCGDAGCPHAHVHDKLVFAGCRWLLVLGCAVLGACASVATDRAETALRIALPALIGPAMHYDVTLVGVSVDATRISAAQVVGLRVAREALPVLNRVQADLTDVTVNRVEKRLTGVGSAVLSVDLLADDLAYFLSARGWSRDVQVSFAAPNTVTATGRVGLPGAGTSVPAKFSGRVRPMGTQLYLDIDALSMGPVAASPVVRLLLQAAVNPLFDIAGFAMPARIESVQIEGAVLRFRASGAALVPRAAQNSAALAEPVAQPTP